MMKSVLAVCMLVVTVYVNVVMPASLNDERIIDNNFNNNNKFGLFNKGNTRNPTNLTCPSDPVCNLTSVRCKSNSDCYPAMPVCCTGSAGGSSQGIRCCNAATQRVPSICPGNNPPPACRSADVCNADSECFTGERCCRTYFGGVLLNTSCCVSATRGPQCPATVTATTCVIANEECGGTSECPTGQVCCSIGGSAALRCCVFPMCSAAITTIRQCLAFNNPALDPTACDAGTNACTGEQRCCHPGQSPFPCCVQDPLFG